MKKIMRAITVVSLLSVSVFTVSCKNDKEKAVTTSTPTYSVETAFVEGGTIVGSADNATFGYSGVFIAGRTVKLSNFYMGKTEVTKKLYKEIMSDTTLNTLGLTIDPSYSTNETRTYVIQAGEVDELRPVENVSWYDAVYFCNLLSKKDGLNEVYTITNPTVSSGTISNATVTADHTKNGYRLPTEAEWEYAARGGKNSFTWNYEYAGADSTATGTPSSDSALDSVGWYSYNICNNGVTTSKEPSSGTAGYGTHEVAKKSPNGLGLYDMSGNVWEWCYDRYGSVETGTVEDPMGALSGSSRVLRGGSWSFNAYFSSVGSRGSPDPNHRDYNLGFRVCRSAQ